MKYIRKRDDGRSEIVQKRGHSFAYFVQAFFKWTFCFFVLALSILLFRYLDKKLNDGRIIKKIIEMARPLTQSLSGNEASEATETQAQEEDVLRVCIDPGHGGMDPGCDYEGRLESADNWQLALEIRRALEEADIDVIMTREDNTTKVFLKDRVEVANASNADYFISIHRNKGDGYGIETWMTAQAGTVTEELTRNVHEAIVGVGVSRDRGIKQGTETGEGSDYYVIGNTKMPACLVEFGFINSAEDNRLFDENLSAYAQAIAQAVLDTHNNNAGRPGEEETPGREETVPPDTGQETSESEAESASGRLLSYPAIDNVSALDKEILNWGQGGNADEYNRPTGCLSYQEKYKDYTADFIIPTTQKKIYLTLDEGYEYGCTPSILATLKEKGVKAVFFVTQSYAKSDPELVRQIIDDGHILGNHSVSHPADGLPSKSLEVQKQEVMDNHAYIKENFGYDMCLFRFPAGKFSEQSLAVLNNCGYRSVFWSFAYLDYDVQNQPNEAESLKKMLDKLHPGAIYLLHAESWTNTNVLGSFIDQAREAGYEFADYFDTLQ